MVLFFITIWTYQFTFLLLPTYQISLYIIVKTITESFVIAVIINLGLWLSTQKFGKKHKYLTFFLMVPSIILNSIIMFSENVIICITMTGIINLIAIFLLFRKDIKNVKNYYFEY